METLSVLKVSIVYYYVPKIKKLDFFFILLRYGTSDL